MRSTSIADSHILDAIIASCPYCVATFNTPADEMPYGIPMNFHQQDGTIYLHSGPEGRKQMLLDSDNRICLVFIAPDYSIAYQDPDVACSHSMRSQSVLVEGRVSFIEDSDEKMRILNGLMEKHTGRRDFKYSAPSIKNVLIWQVNIEKKTGKRIG